MEKENMNEEKNLNQEAEEVLEKTETDSEIDNTEEVSRLKDQLLRTLADLENTRKRAEREKEEIRKYAVAGFCKDLLSVVDTLDRALESVPEEEKKSHDLFKRLYEGIELTRNEMAKTFVKHHITKITPTGQKFDHNFHQAVVEVPSADHEAGMVVDVLQAGYAIDDRLLRPAMVTVSKGKE
ncbi:MAG: nucleotide exchange factor GrpE [Alphaproteobacteria bacterium]